MLSNKIKRTNLVTWVWKHACRQDPSTLQPDQNGWVLRNNMYVIDWFTGEQLPPNLCDLLVYDGNPSHDFKVDETEAETLAVWDSDVIYATTRGRTKPGKHLTLGLGLKSMTGSRKVIEVLNRHGHCIGYHTAEIIETELATQIDSQSPKCYPRWPFATFRTRYIFGRGQLWWAVRNTVRCRDPPWHCWNLLSKLNWFESCD